MTVIRDGVLLATGLKLGTKSWLTELVATISRSTFISPLCPAGILILTYRLSLGHKRKLFDLSDCPLIVRSESRMCRLGECFGKSPAALGGDEKLREGATLFLCHPPPCSYSLRDMIAAMTPNHVSGMNLPYFQGIRKYTPGRHLSPASFSRNRWRRLWLDMCSTNE
jgi:hypothetical protein